MDTVTSILIVSQVSSWSTYKVHARTTRSQPMGDPSSTDTYPSRLASPSEFWPHDAPAIKLDSRTVDERSCAAREEDACAGDILGRADPTKRDVRLDDLALLAQRVRHHYKAGQLQTATGDVSKDLLLLSKGPTEENALAYCT